MIHKLERQTLAERAATQLAAFIQSDLQPGATLPSEAKLAQMLGVSRPIVREGLKSLQGQGLVAVINGHGAVVQHLTPSMLLAYFSRAMQLKDASILELIEVRRGIESESARLAALRCTKPQIAQMQQMVVQMRQALGDAEIYSGLDVQLHILIGQASQNAIIAHLVESIREALREVSQQGLQRHQPDELSRVQELHEQLVDCIIRRDAVGAVQTMTLHMDEAMAAFARNSH